MSNSKIFISRDFKYFRVINVKHETFTDMPANYSNSSIMHFEFHLKSYILVLFNLLILPLSLFLSFLIKDYKSLIVILSEHTIIVTFIHNFSNN